VNTPNSHRTLAPGSPFQRGGGRGAGGLPALLREPDEARAGGAQLDPLPPSHVASHFLLPRPTDAQHSRHHQPILRTSPPIRQNITRPNPKN